MGIRNQFMIAIAVLGAGVLFCFEMIIFGKHQKLESQPSNQSTHLKTTVQPNAFPINLPLSASIENFEPGVPYKVFMVQKGCEYALIESASGYIFRTSDPKVLEMEGGDHFHNSVGFGGIPGIVKISKKEALDYVETHHDLFYSDCGP